MNTVSKNDVHKKINYLPNELMPTVMVYLDFLLNQHAQHTTKAPPTFNWAGGLSDMKSEYDGVSLQKKSLEWR
jgi:hypothetical protein